MIISFGKIHVLLINLNVRAWHIIVLDFSLMHSNGPAVAYPGFSRGANPNWVRQSIIWYIFPENCMKSKKTGPRDGGGARFQICLLQSEVDYVLFTVDDSL